MRSLAYGAVSVFLLVAADQLTKMLAVELNVDYFLHRHVDPRFQLIYLVALVTGLILLAWTSSLAIKTAVVLVLAAFISVSIDVYYQGGSVDFIMVVVQEGIEPFMFNLADIYIWYAGLVALVGFLFRR